MLPDLLLHILFSLTDCGFLTPDPKKWKKKKRDDEDYTYMEDDVDQPDGGKFTKLIFEIISN